MKREIKIGLFALAMLAAAWAGIRFLKGFDLFSRNIEYYARYDRIDGVQAASPIMMRGVKIGSVTGIDFDPEDNSPALWGRFNADVDDNGITRLICNAKIVGTHELWIQLKNNDYKWANEEKYYIFKLIIDAASVADVNFNYGDPDTAVLIGGDGDTLHR